MEILTILIIVILILLALGLIVYPLWKQSWYEMMLPMDLAGQSLEEVQARYQATLAAIKVLMFDYEMGKVSEEDYESLLGKAKLEAATYRKELDRLSDGTHNLDTALDAQIEALITQARETPLNGSTSTVETVNAEIELLKKTGAPSTTGNNRDCPTCGQAFEANDTFCVHCGQMLTDAAPQTDTNFCPKCGMPTQHNDAFCVKCGHALAQAVTVSSSK